MLNEEQRRAVECDNHCLVVACPGSGKTKLLVSKVSYIFSRQPDAKIVLLTFTKEAAAELRDRVMREVGDKAKSQCFISTFHSLALRHLMRMRIKPRLARDSERREYIARAIEAAGVDMQIDNAVQGIERCKSILDFQPLKDDISKVYVAFQDLMQKNGIMDFFDIMQLSVNYLRDGSLPVLGATHMMLDEFQDTDNVQYEYILAHFKTGQIILTAVGDDDQAIYGFRNSLGYHGMTRFEKDTSATRITLGINYRCHSEILSPADRLIRFNDDRMNKPLHAAKGPGGSIDLRRFGMRDEEAELIVANILESCRHNPFPPPDNPKDVGDRVKDPKYKYSVWVKPREWGVLARNNSVLDTLDAYLSCNRIPFSRAGKSFWGSKPISFMLSLLSDLETRQKAGIDQMLYWAGITNSEMEILHRVLKNDFYQLLTCAAAGSVPMEEFDKPSQAILELFIRHGAGWVKEANKKSDHRTAMAIDGVSEWMLLHTRKKSEVSKIQTATTILKKMSGSLQERIGRLLREQKKDLAGGVSLLTMHGSKGLEFDNVAIVGAEESVIPSAKEDSDIGEERRLMYVAMTRARNKLIITSSADNVESRFIQESGLFRKFGDDTET